MLIVGYCYGIRSERRLCEEVHLNLAYRWFCRLGLEDAVPDHSTFSKNRHGRFRESGTFRWLFERVVRQCMAAHLVNGYGFPRWEGGPVFWARERGAAALQADLDMLAEVSGPGFIRGDVQYLLEVKA